MNGLTNILHTFTPVSLNEIEGVKLMDRTDRKFTLNINRLEILLSKLEPFYKVLKIDECLLNTYQTLYFDTSHLDLYLNHHSGKADRYKIRHRTYVESELGFLEVKHKNNKGRTIKERIKLKTPPENWDEKSSLFLSKKSPYLAKFLKPSVWVNYQRITLVGKTNPERVTIDINLEFIHDTNEVALSYLTIVEVKQSKRAASPIIAVLKEMKIREGSISKYCLGITSIYKNIKQNNFKEKLHSINKLNYDIPVTTPSNS